MIDPYVLAHINVYTSMRRERTIDFHGHEGEFWIHPGRKPTRYISTTVSCSGASIASFVFCCRYRVICLLSVKVCSRHKTHSNSGKSSTMSSNCQYQEFNSDLCQCSNLSQCKRAEEDEPELHIGVRVWYFKFCQLRSESLIFQVLPTSKLRQALWIGVVTVITVSIQESSVHSRASSEVKDIAFTY